MNVFSLLLAIVSLITGLAYGYDYFAKRPTRLKNLKAALEMNPQLSDKEIRALKDGSSIITQVGALFPVILFVFLFRAFVYEPFRIPSGSMEPTLVAGDFIFVSKWSYGIRNPFDNSMLIPTGTPQRGDVVVFKYPEDPQIDYIKRVIGLPGDEVIVANKRVYLRRACNVGLVTPQAVHPADDDATTSNSANGTTAQASAAQEIADNAALPCQSPQAVPTKLIGEMTAEHGTYEDKYLIFEETLGEKPHQMQINTGFPDVSQYFYRQKGVERSTWVVPEGYYFVMGDNRDNSKDSRFWGFVPMEYMIGRTDGIWLSLEFSDDPERILPSFIPSSVRFSRIGGID